MRDLPSDRNGATWATRLPARASTGREAASARRAEAAVAMIHDAWMWAHLRGTDGPAPPGDEASQASLLAAIDEHNVASLLHDRWQARIDDTSIPPSLRTAVAQRARTSAMRHLVRLAECRRISAALGTAGIDFIWLKGAALSAWLYASPHLRPSNDIDMLFASHADALRAAEALAPLGYRLPNRHIAGDLYVHELLAVNTHLGMEFDMHWRLANTALFSERLRWEDVRAQAFVVPALGSDALVLAPVHALMHACIHRACNHLIRRENSLYWLYDIHLLALRLSQEEWSRFTLLAVERRLADPCLDALDACVARLGTILPEHVNAQLASAAKHESLRSARLRNWYAFQWATLRELPDLRTRLRWLRQMLIGDLAALRDRYARAHETPSTLRLIARRAVDGFRRLMKWTHRSRR